MTDKLKETSQDTFHVGMMVEYSDGTTGVIDEVYLTRDGGMLHTREFGWVKASSVRGVGSA